MGSEGRQLSKRAFSPFSKGSKKIGGDLFQRHIRNHANKIEPFFPFFRVSDIGAA